MIKNYLKLMRIHHYIKNLLIFAPLACSGQLFILDKFLSGLIGFFAFSFISSIVYIVNDIQDRERDKIHPTKCKRPIASGEITVRNARILAVALFVLALACNLCVLKTSSSILLLVYFVLNLLYSFGLKNVPIVDISILVAGFLIRIIYGAVITEIVISNWLYLTVIALAFYFALGKRRNESKRPDSHKTRKVLQSYPVNFLDKNMYMCLALTNVFYALWSMDESTIALYNNKYLIYTVPIVLLITMKYSMNVEGDSDGDPVEVLIHDKMLLVLCALYLVVMFLILYL